MIKKLRLKLTYAVDYVRAWGFMFGCLLYVAQLEVKERMLSRDFKRRQCSMYTSAQLKYLMDQTRLSKEEVIALAVRKLTEHFRQMEDVNTRHNHGNS